MKKIILVLVAVLYVGTISAKKVKFAVDMTGITLPLGSTGVHIMGDFQTISGTGSDFVPYMITQEGITDIYSIIVDIPAFAKYEYKFLSSLQTYDAEFVPIESRVGYNFNDNRWIYLDSLANDTTYFGAVRFGGNAPAGLTLVRYLVDMQNAGSVSTNGVHVGGNFQGWNSSKNILYNFDASTVYEVITYVTNGTYEYKYYNGNTSGDIETISGACTVNGNRQINVTTDIVLDALCYSYCTDCANALGIASHSTNQSSILSPNPAENYANINFADGENVTEVIIVDQLGRQVKNYDNVNSTSLQIETNDMQSGIYFVSVFGKNSLVLESLKLIVK
jgi:hypothetical protein